MSGSKCTTDTTFYVFGCCNFFKNKQNAFENYPSMDSFSKPLTYDRGVIQILGNFNVLYSF